MNKRSKCLIVSALLATAYTVYLIAYFYGGVSNSASDSEILGNAIATAIITPHLIMFAIGVIFGWVAVALKANWAALVAAILYSVGTALFFTYAMFGIPILVLGFIGYANQKKLNQAGSQNEQ